MATTESETVNSFDLNTKSSLQSRLPRTGAVLITALVIQFWLGWLGAFVWAAACLGWDWVVERVFYGRFMGRLLAGRPKLTSRYRLCLIFIGGVISTSGWATAWAIGDAPAYFVAGIWFYGTLVHGLGYYSNRPSEFFAMAGSGLIAAMVLPWFVAPAGVALGMCVTAALATLMILQAIKDRNALMDSTVEMRAGREAAERANAAKSQFLAGMSHELRTPLTAIIGYAELLEEDAQAEQRADTAKDAARIHAAARHLLTLINEVLDFAKIEAGRMEVVNDAVDVPAALAEALDLLQPMARANGNTLTLDAEAAPRLIETDSTKLRQCVLNLVGNACKFTCYGSVQVVAAMERGPQGPMLRIDVSDTGPGIAPEVQARLFQPFVQAEPGATRQRGGTGLGLVLTQRMAELLGGSVSLVSAPGKGSTFTLRVAARPVSDRAPLVARAA